jgi:siroheme synthase
MPGTGLRQLSSKLIAAGLASDTPAVLVARASTAQQQEFWTTVGGLRDLDSSASPSILIIGRSLDAAAARAALKNLENNEILTALSHPPLERRIIS